MNIKDMVKDKRVYFMYFREGELWYMTESGFSFPVPISDVGTAVMKNEDKAILFMRWIRKHLEMIEKAKEDTTFTTIPKVELVYSGFDILGNENK